MNFKTTFTNIIVALFLLMQWNTPARVYAADFAPGGDVYQTSDPADISPLANVVVTLSGPGGTRSTPASISGAYQFPDLAAGNYSVSVPTPAGLFHFSPPTVPVAVGADTLDPVVNFAFARRGSVLFLPQVERNVLPYPDQR